MGRYTVFMTGHLKTVTMSTLPKLIYRISIIPIKIPAKYFTDIDTYNIKLMCK